MIDLMGMRERNGYVKFEGKEYILKTPPQHVGGDLWAVEAFERTSLFKHQVRWNTGEPKQNGRGEYSTPSNVGRWSGKFETDEKP
jgi:hypothetical protein